MYQQLLQACREILSAAGFEETGVLRMEPIAETTSGIHRLRVQKPDGGNCTWIVKRVSRMESAVHRLVCREFPGVTPQVVGYRPLGEPDNTDELLLMEEARDDRPERSCLAVPAALPASAVVCQPAFLDALQGLAAVHARFRGRAEELRLLGVLPACVVSRRDSLAWCLDLLGFATHEQAAELAVMDSLAEQQGQHLLTSDSWTLVHGDFHLGNVVHAGGRSIAILDWGDAAIGVPAWDLTLCGEAEAGYYFGALQRHAPGFMSELRFYRQLRAAVICRMRLFLVKGLDEYVHRGNTAFATIFPVCIDRFLAAAGSPGFRGGRGIRFFGDAGGGEQNDEQRDRQARLFSKPGYARAIGGPDGGGGGGVQ